VSNSDHDCEPDRKLLVPDMPREMLDQTLRFIPGDGVSPLAKILRKLADKGYSGPLSVELFLPKFRTPDLVEFRAIQL